MKIKETIERDCCNPNKDLRKVSVKPNTHVNDLKKYFFCIHCGQWWKGPSFDTIDGPHDYSYTKVSVIW